MTIVVCIDDQGGILFNHRRVSADCAVISDLMELAGEQTICMRPYSAKLFPVQGSIRVTEQYLSDTCPGEILFLEDAVPENLMTNAKKLIVYRWNRLYPSDVRFPLDLLQRLGKPESSVDFRGNSHSKITREVYVL